MKSRFTNQSLLQIIKVLEEKLKNLSLIEFDVLNPDLSTNSYAGEKIQIENEVFIYRSFRSWVELATILNCKILTPILNNDNTITIRYKKLNDLSSFHKTKQTNEKYGVDSEFGKINKNEEPSFLHYYKEALKNAKIDKKQTILNIGVNSGDEFDAIKNLSTNFKDQNFIGIDYCPSAIEFAKDKFKKDTNIDFYCHDVNDLNSLDIKKFDLIISIGTLQSTTVDFKPLFMSLIQNYLNSDGAIILGFPNCRWIDGEIVYGARTKNYSFPEASLLHKDIYFCKKYLQQKKFRVTITGKDYIFLTATSIK